MQGRKDEDYSWAFGFNDVNTEREVRAERAFVKWLDGGCTSPIAAFAVCGEDQMTIEGLYYDEASGKWHRESMSGSPYMAEELGIELAKTMKGRYE